MGVLEHEQEAIAERGAAGLSSSKEEREHGYHEVLVMELCVVVGLLLVPDGREKGGSGVNERLQGDAHTSLALSCLILSGPLDIAQQQTVFPDFFCLLSLLCSLVVDHVLSPRVFVPLWSFLLLPLALCFFPSTPLLSPYHFLLPLSILYFSQVLHLLHCFYLSSPSSVSSLLCLRPHPYPSLSPTPSLIHAGPTFSMRRR